MISEELKKEGETKFFFPFSDGMVILDFNHRHVRIHYNEDAKPTIDKIKALRESGFRWDTAFLSWVQKMQDYSVDSVSRITDVDRQKLLLNYCEKMPHSLLLTN